MRFLGGLLAALTLSVAHAQPSLDDFATPPTIWWAEISPDGSMLAMGCTIADIGKQEICFFDMAGGGVTGKIASPEGIRILSFYWINNRYLAYIVTYTDEIRTRHGPMTVPLYRTYAFDIETRGNVQLMRDEDHHPSLTNVVSLMNGDDSLVMMQMGYLWRSERANTNLRGPENRDLETTLFEVDLDSGRSEPVRSVRSGQGVHDNIVDADGAIVARVFHDPETGDYRIVRGTDTNAVLFSGNYGLRIPQVHGVISGGRELAVSFPAGPNDGLRRLDLASGELAPFTLDGEEVHRLGVLIDRRRGELAGFRHGGDIPGHRYTDPELAAVQRALEDALYGHVRLLSWTDDRSLFTFAIDNRGEPTGFFLFDVPSGGLQSIGNEAPAIAETELSAVESVHYEASDGLGINAYMVLPPGQGRGDGPFPLVLMPHGGPEARDHATYDWWAQFYASLGYVVLKPNFRGSSGYGDDFRDAGFGEFGGRMIEDMLDGARYLQAEGIVREGGFCTVGASYGGYAALMTALRAPDEVRCVVGVSAVTDPFRMLGNMRLRGGSESDELRYWHDYIGTIFDDEARQHEITPLDRVDEYGVPVLLVHGDDDTTVEVEQSRLMASAMEGREGFRYVEMSGEDHYLGTYNARHTLLSESRDFLQRHLPAD
jgi:dipeptidyl aminopeptidase/acylaminoacyl peptidase